MAIVVEREIPEDLKNAWNLDSKPHPILLEPGVEIRSTRRPNLVDAWVPVSMLRTHDLPVDDAQIALLQEDFKAQKALGHENGQRDAIGAAVLKDQDIEFGISIHDGYHRSNLLERNGELRALTSITIDCTPQELIRLRTLAATPHEWVKPPRMVLTLGQQWGFTEWAAQGIKITQAFQLIINSHNTLGTKRFKSPQEAEEAAKFIKNACKGWGVAEINAYKYFLTSEVADPDIFFAIEGRRNGRELRALTFQHVQAIARKEYGKKNLAGMFGIQRLVRDAVLEQGLNIHDTQVLVKAIVGLEELDEDEAKRVIDEGLWRTQLKSDQVETTNRTRSCKLTAGSEKAPWWRTLTDIDPEDVRIMDKIFPGDGDLSVLRKEGILPNKILQAIQSTLARRQLELRMEKLEGKASSNLNSN